MIKIFYKCECGTLIHLNTTEINKILNPLCIYCLKDKDPFLYRIEFEVFPFRAIYHVKVFATSKENAVDIFRNNRGNKNIKIRKIEIKN